MIPKAKSCLHPRQSIPPDCLWLSVSRLLKAAGSLSSDCALALLFPLEAESESMTTIVLLIGNAPAMNKGTFP